jgi:hypothetical protein
LLRRNKHTPALLRQGHSSAAPAVDRRPGGARRFGDTVDIAGASA